MRGSRDVLLGAGSCLATACLAAFALITPGQRAAASTPTRTTAPAPERDSTAGVAGRRQRELDELRRRDVARDLGARGVTVRWQDHPLAELVDWRERIDAANALAADHGVTIDWRAESAASLTDMRLRAAKADELRARYGIVVDWRDYSWRQIEGLRMSLQALRPQAEIAAGGGGPAARRIAAPDPDALLAPFAGGWNVRRPRPDPGDPDAIVEPSFVASATGAGAGSALGPRHRPDTHPDGLLPPTFPRNVPRPSHRGPDDLAAPDFRR